MPWILTSLSRKSARLVAALLVMGLGAISGPVSAQGATGRDALVDADQKTYQIDTYTQLAASGPARGKTLYYYKCWACHNELATDSGPYLKGVMDRFSEQAVAAKVRSGGPRMPGFTNLTDADIEDLISYLRTEDCCFESKEPPLNPAYHAESSPWPVPAGLWGGPTGLVRSVDGDLLEGMKVQLIAPSGVRLTVFTNEEGRYEFPGMKDGAYTLRIATPAPYKAWRREGVRVSGIGELPAIELELVPNPVGESHPEQSGLGALFGAMPATQAILSQLSGAELLWNLPGTAQEKATFARTCGLGCHAYQQIFRNRFTEHGWRVMIDRMLRYAGNALINTRSGFGRRGSEEEVEQSIRWLAKVRGPDSPEDLPLRRFPRVQGEATEVVITEYEMPRRLLSIHDTYGDAEGNIWYTSHRTPYAGVLDPRTGIISEHKLPPSPGYLPGSHAVIIDNERRYAWFSENWARRYSRLDMDTGENRIFNLRMRGGNFGMGPDGYLWGNSGAGLVVRGGNEIVRIDPEDGEITDVYPLKNPLPYQNTVSSDGRFWAGGTPPTTSANTAEMLDIESGTMYEVNSGDRIHSAARGAFEPNGDDAWFGGRDGVFVEVVNEIDEGRGIHIRTYYPPTPPYPFTMFYTAIPDKNGDVWGGVLQGGGFARYNQQSKKWTVYENAEPSALARHTWVDNSTDPVSVWYPDFHTGLIVRIQSRPVNE